MSQMKKLVMVVMAMALVGVLVGVVWAQWLATGTGQGRARATIAVEAVVNPVDGVPDLFPGVTDGDVYFTITNDNPYEISFDTMTSGAIVSSDPAGCPPGSITVTDPPAGSLSLVAPPGSTTGMLSIADVVAMPLTAPNGCQGVSFDIELTLTGEQTS